MILTLFAIIGMEIGAGKMYWVMLAITAVMKLLNAFFGFSRRAEDGNCSYGERREGE